MRKKLFSPITLAMVAIVLLLACSVPDRALNILIPLYIYPMPYDPPNYTWLQVAEANRRVAITAVINPNNGSGMAPPNRDYAQGINDLRAAGVQLLGYISTRYGDRPLADIKTEVDVYAAHFAVDGIFLDEAASQAAQLDYYAELYAYIKAKQSSYQVVLNQGTQPDPGYVSRPAADVVVVFENSASAWASYLPPAYLPDYDSHRFAALIHSEPTSSGMEQAIALAQRRHIGYLYVTDASPDTGDRNPWNRLPAYWGEEITTLQTLNQTAARRSP